MAQPHSTPQGAADEWIGRVKGFVNQPKDVTDPSPASHSAWTNSLFGCFNPIDECAITCCCPCITFGKTHHRLRGDPELKDYSVVNGSCLVWWVAGCFGVPCLIQMLQRHEIRSRFALQGSGVTDCLQAWCCHCCDLIQQDKEAKYHLLKSAGQHEMVTSEPEKQNGNMGYPAPPQQTV